MTRNDNRRRQGGLSTGARTALLTAGLIAALGGVPAQAAEPGASTLSAYDAYLNKAIAALDSGVARKDILWANDSPQRLGRLQAGEVIAEPWGAEPIVAIDGGEISDVIGAVMIPGKSLDQVLALMQDYNSYAKTFAPEIAASKLLAREGDRFQVAVKLVKKIVIAIGFQLEQTTNFTKVSPTQWQSRGHSTRLTELKGVGTAAEAELSAAENHGYLWRAFTLDNFEQVDGGVIVESRTVSLSAPLPPALRWMASTLGKLPQQSMTNKLEAVRKALRP
ncbi:MAG: hypothetical protein R2762_27190 [Bryobacteraceae bacterium]